MSTPAEYLNISRPARLPKLRKGSGGQAVEYAQALLNYALGWHPPLKPILGVDGDFGGGTEDGVSLFQYRFGLPITGKIDEADWRMLERFYPTSTQAPFHDGGPTQLFPANIYPLALVGMQLNEPQKTLPSFARPYLGARETGNNRMGTDERMREIFEADDLAPGGETDGYAWCAAFVSLCVQKLVAAYPLHYSGVTAPREPSVSRFLNNWATHQKCLIFKPSSKVISPQAGDIVVYTFSHIGIVESLADRIATTIEGNTNDEGSREGYEVANRDRNFSLIRAFIRLPVKRIFA